MICLQIAVRHVRYLDPVCAKLNCNYFQMRREMSQAKSEPQARVEIQSFKSNDGFKMPQTMPHTPGTILTKFPHKRVSFF